MSHENFALSVAALAICWLLGLGVAALLRIARALDKLVEVFDLPEEWKKNAGPERKTK